MTYNVFSGTLNPTHFTSVLIIRLTWNHLLSRCCHLVRDGKSSLITQSSVNVARVSISISDYDVTIRNGT